MAFDFKKEYREFYLPKDRPEIVTVPRANYIALRGSGDPNEEDGAYRQAIGVLYALAYTLKMSYKTDHRIEGFYEYVVPPLEGFWEQDGTEGIDYGNKAAFRWISVIRLPDFVTEEDFRWSSSLTTRATRTRPTTNLMSARRDTQPTGPTTRCGFSQPFTSTSRSPATPLSLTRSFHLPTRMRERFTST